MSTGTQQGDDLEERVANFPQIQMHGGSAAIQDLDRKTDEEDRRQRITGDVRLQWGRNALPPPGQVVVI